MSKYGDLTPATIWQIACDAQDGISDPDEVRRMLTLFCECQENNQPIPKEILLHFRMAFRVYLDGEKSIEAGLGLVKKKARPKADPNLRTDMALMILKLRLDGISHQKAVAGTVDHYGWGKTITEKAWADHKSDAWVRLRIEQHIGAYPTQSNQVERLIAILGESPLVTSVKSPTKVG